MPTHCPATADGSTCCRTVCPFRSSIPMDAPIDSEPAIDHVLNVDLPPKRPGVWNGLGIVALYFLLQLGISILVGMVFGIALAIRTGLEADAQHAKFDPNAIARLMQASPDIHTTVTVTTIVAAAAIMALLVRRFWPGQWSRGELPGFGLRQPDNKLVYAGAVALGIVVLFAGGALTQLLAGSQPVRQDVAMMAGSVSTGMRVLLAMLVVCVAPFVEELVFRGVLLSGLASRMRTGWAMPLSAVIFGAAHLPDFNFAWYPVPALVLLGVVLAWLCVRTRSLWPSITLHATNNFVAVLGWFLLAGPH